MPLRKPKSPSLVDILHQLYRSTVILDKCNPDPFGWAVRFYDNVFPLYCFGQIFHFKSNMGNSLYDFRQGAFRFETHPLNSVRAFLIPAHIHLETRQVYFFGSLTICWNPEMVILQHGTKISENSIEYKQNTILLMNFQL